jgi:osmotically-inducible protein OsmY
MGVKGVFNAIGVTPRASAIDVKVKIEDALKRNAEVDARRISVQAIDGKVTLTGNVRSWFEKQEAATAAWAAPGVKEVNNQIAVVP